MEVIVLDNPEQVADRAAAILCDLVSRKPDAVLGLATGRTPIEMYRRLVQYHVDGSLSLSGVRTFNLDEYLGLPPGHPQSYRAFMQEELFDLVDIQARNTHLPECSPGEDPRKVGPVYEQLIADCGGIDLQVLGIGRNGHIGFNEPSSSLSSRTRVKTLDPRTVQDNSRLFAGDEFQPHLAITMGIGTIMDARRVMLLATGESKAAAVQALVEGAISSMHPATVLQHHRCVRVILDEAAASSLSLADYYRWVQAESDAVAARHGGSADSDPWFWELQDR